MILGTVGDTPGRLVIESPNNGTSLFGTRHTLSELRTWISFAGSGHGHQAMFYTGDAPSVLGLRFSILSGRR